MRLNSDTCTELSLPSNESSRNCFSCFVFAMTEYGELNETDLKSVEMYNSFVKTNGSSVERKPSTVCALALSRKKDTIREAVSKKKLLIEAEACTYWCSPIV